VTILGVVESFDDRRGDGEILSDQGERLYFHCVSISDGSRTIEVGTRITGRRRTGHRGRDEVSAIRR
jgi:cold shock CspA family protein